MTFGPSKEPKIDDKDPSQCIKLVSDQLWSRLKKTIFDMNKTTMKEFSRFILMKNPTEDYLTKLDLIESFPQVFRKNSKFS